MPSVASPLHRRQGTAGPGGTSAEAESGSFAMWIALLTVAVVVGAVVFFATRGGDSKTSGAGGVAISGDAGDERDLDAAVADLVDDVAADDGDAGEPVTVEDALGALEQALSEARLYSGVEVSADDETVVHIESAQCEDPGLRAAVLAAREELVSAGFVGVQCYSLHGTRLFATDL